ncbi:glycosyltransferase family 4 protein [Gillisia sp. JM1]|uniref:glycosyltransferase family 4 protein n=1 Tax=Gillisia sp. JM1 TaxID=1283286 RepID=UPI00042A92B2|nr:glycosyltransferase [Gillisia sp. JM1]
MKFLVVTSAPTLFKSNIYSAYAPYVNEMNIWFSKVEEAAILSPGTYPDEIFTKAFENQNLKLYKIPFLNSKSVIISIRSLLLLPFIIRKMLLAFLWADHIHLRCPGNIGLIASIFQVFFPNKPKTVKYAGNWDPNSKQPWSYRLQKRILSNTFLSKNIKVLVYGDWPEQSKNIVPFFTASFSETEKGIYRKNFTSPFRFIFVGNLSAGKRPLFAIQIIEALMTKGIPVKLEIYGSGLMKNELQEYIATNNLEPFVRLMGNLKLKELKEVYKASHFLILASQSEGWPKAVAEAMFFGCIPIATPVSSVPWMLNYGKRGILIPPPDSYQDLQGEQKAELCMEETVNKIKELIGDSEEMKHKSLAAQKWSQEYTLEKFEEAIKEVLGSDNSINIKSSSPFGRGGGVG